MIIVKNASIRYSNQVVFQNLNIEFEHGKVYGIVGRNGVGKTTLLKAIVGLKEINSGKIFLSSGDEIVNQCVAVFQEDFIYKKLYPIEFLRYYISINSQQFNDNTLKKYLNYLELPKDKLVEQLSAGNYKKLSVLSRWLSNRNFLLLDEPYNTLDSITCMKFNALFKKYTEDNKSILLSSHIVEPMLEVCDIIYFLIDKDTTFKYEAQEFDIFKNKFYDNILNSDNLED